MVQLMVEHDGCGLAAPQVGIQLRMLVMNHMRIFSRPDLTFRFINPVIINRFGGTSLLEEGCLSLPGTRVKVRRPRKVKFEAWLPDGTLFQNTFTGFPARVLQHEVDHLDGKLIIDYRDAETG